MYPKNQLCRCPTYHTKRAVLIRSLRRRPYRMKPTAVGFISLTTVMYAVFSETNHGALNEMSYDPFDLSWSMHAFNACSVVFHSWVLDVYICIVTNQARQVSRIKWAKLSYNSLTTIWVTWLEIKRYKMRSILLWVALSANKKLYLKVIRRQGREFRIQDDDIQVVGKMRISLRHT